MKALLVDFSPYVPAVTPISLGGIGAVLAERGWGVRVLGLGTDTSFSRHSLATWVRAESPDLVGFGVYQRNFLQVRALAALVKSVLPRAKVVLGGPQATFLPSAALGEIPEVDFLSRGEGEISMERIAEALEAGALDVPVANSTHRDPHGAVVDGPHLEPCGELDRYPSPWLTGVLDPGATDECIMLTSRGCTNQCAFCHTPGVSSGRIRSLPVERVLDELAYVAARGTGRVWFADPNFSFSRKRVVSILEGVLQREIGLSMWLESRADMLDRELLDLMKRAGVHTVAMGLESASPNVWPRLNKDLEPDQIRQAVENAFDVGLDVELFSQYALPGETLEDALRTLEFVNECGVKIRGNSNAQQMQLYFGSEITESHEEFGIRPLRESFPTYLSIGTEFETEWMDRREIDQVASAWRAASLDGGKRIVS